MSELFDTYETHFLNAIRQLQKQLDQHDNMQLINQTLAQAGQELSKMELEYSMCKHKDMKNKISLYKTEIKVYKRKVAETNDLKDDNDRLSDENLEKEEGANLKLLQEGRRQMYQNVQISNQAMLGIKRNSDKLQNNITRMANIDGNLASAQQLLSSIKFKMSKNRYMLYGTVSILVMLMVYVVYTHVK